VLIANDKGQLDELAFVVALTHRADADGIQGFLAPLGMTTVF